MALTSEVVQLGMLSRWADNLGDTQADSISATGVNQGGAYALSSSINNITGGTTGVNFCVKLPQAATYKQSYCFVTNSQNPATMAQLDIYPYSGDSINHLAANTQVSIVGRGAKLFFRISSTKWVAL